MGQSVSVAGRHPGSSTAAGARQLGSWPAGAGKRKSRRYPQTLGRTALPSSWRPRSSRSGDACRRPPFCDTCRMLPMQNAICPDGVTRPATRHAPAALQPSPAERHCLRNVASGRPAQRLPADSAADGEDVRGRVPQFPPSPQGHRARRRWGSCRQDGGAYCRPDPPGTAVPRGRPRGSRPPPDAQSPARSPAAAHNARADHWIPAVKAHCRAIHRPEGIERRRWRRMLT
jgi:hypothetical protein